MNEWFWDRAAALDGSAVKNAAISESGYETAQGRFSGGISGQGSDRIQADGEAANAKSSESNDLEAMII